MTDTGGPARQGKQVPFLLFLALAAIILLIIAPIFSALTASFDAWKNGCVRHDGFANPCSAGGHGLGQWLVSMAVMAWLMFITSPIGAVGLGIWAAVAVIVFRRRARRKGKA